MYIATCSYSHTNRSELNWSNVRIWNGSVLALLVQDASHDDGQRHRSNSESRTRKKTDTDTHTCNALSEIDTSDSGDEPTHAVLVAVTTVLMLTIAVSVTVITCITVTTCTPEVVDALLLVAGDRKRKVKVSELNEHTLNIRKLQHYIHVNRCV